VEAQMPLKKKKRKSPLKTKSLKTKIKIWATAFVIVMVALETAWQWFPSEFPKDISITAGILDNIPYAVALFLLIPYHNIAFKLAALLWLMVELGDGLMRLVMLYTYYMGGNEAAQDIHGLLSFIGWLYFLVPLSYLMWRYKHFSAGVSDTYNLRDTFLFFRNPGNIRDLIVSFFGGSTATVYPIHKGTCYYFRKGQPFSKSKFIHRGDGRLIKITPPKGFNAFLDSKLGTKYHIYSNNCVSVMRGSGLKIGVLDFIPSIFLLRYHQRAEKPSGVSST